MERDSFMDLIMRRVMPRTGSRRVPVIGGVGRGARTGEGGGDEGAAEAAAGAGEAGGGMDGAPPRRARTSSLSTLPLAPDPATVARSMPCSLAIFLTAGVVSTLPVSAGLDLGPCPPAAPAFGASGMLSFCFISPGSSVLILSSPPSPPPSPPPSTDIIMSGSPTLSISPTSPLRLSTTPSNLLVISTVALSDCTSQTLSNCETSSPGETNHWRSSTSAMPSPMSARRKGMEALEEGEAENGREGDAEGCLRLLIVPKLK
mmetsp:Transcript_19619/g.39220  ORF Transcript_19619/g.39220 Transcript_19619/m.39220 type:complete len:260 (+) Transcript_19619:681-1460(+)